MIFLDNKLRLIVCALLAVSLIFTITNKVFVSTSFLLLFPLVFFIFFKRGPYPSFHFYLFALFTFFGFSTLIYDPQAFTKFEFFRRDGNFFISYAPFLILSPFAFRVNIRQFTWYFLILAATISGMMVAVHFVFKQPQELFFLFFYAHNAAGGFLSILTSFALGFYYYKRNKLTLSLLIFSSISLLATDSRGSILGLGAACLLVFILKGKWKSIFTTSLVVITIGIAAINYINCTEKQLTDYFDVSEVESFIGRSRTINDRASNLWPKALHLFFSSPLIGTGFGSYNDWPYNLASIIPGVQLNQPHEYLYNSSHAHHSYLNVLGECGLIGITLLLCFLFSMHRQIKSLEQGAVRLGLMLGFWTNIFSSFTEHRLFTPAQILPYALILSLAICNHYYELSLKAKQSKAISLR